MAVGKIGQTNNHSKLIMEYSEERNNISINLVQMRYGIIGNSPEIISAIEKVIQVAPTDLPVLITGETGTGKEVFANAIHGMSNRRKYPMVSVNCGAIPETLLESELFGHEKGAFTGAIDQRTGFFESAHKGTIFLDEIGEMPLGTQVKLLRVLESGEFSRLGSSTLHKVDVRLIAATNRELEIEVAQGKFREDLFYRLNAVHIKLPPLRKHIEDIPQLVDYFAEKTCSKLGIRYQGISLDALDILKSLHWKGNIRELKNLVETIVTIEKGDYITPQILSRYLPAALPAHEARDMPYERSIIQTIKNEYAQQFELGLIFRTLLELRNSINDLKEIILNLNEKIENISFNQNPAKNIKNYSIEKEIDKINLDSLNLEDIEKQLIEIALEKYNGNRRNAANALGISERSLYRKINKYDLEKRDDN